MINQSVGYGKIISIERKNSSFTIVELPRKVLGKWHLKVKGWACEKWEDLQRKKIEEAKKLLANCDKGMLEYNFGYGMVSRFQLHNYISVQFLEACYKAGDMALAEKVSNSVKKDLEQQMNYYAALGEMSTPELQQAIGRSVQIRYQQERDNFVSNLSKKLCPIYDDAERGYQFLKGIEAIEQQYKVLMHRR